MPRYFIIPKKELLKCSRWTRKYIFADREPFQRVDMSTSCDFLIANNNFALLLHEFFYSVGAVC